MKLAMVGAVVLASGTLHALVVTAVGPLLLPPKPAVGVPAAAVQVRSIEAGSVPSESDSPAPPAPAVADPSPATSPAPPATPPTPPARKPVPLSYLATAEVDEPATPRTDWAIDMSGLARIGMKVLRFEILVDAAGVAQQCRVLSTEPPLPASHATLSAQLCNTAMSPAMRRGIAVPNMRHIELVFNG